MPSQIPVDIGFLILMIFLSSVFSCIVWLTSNLKSALITFLVLLILIGVGEFLHFS